MLGSMAASLLVGVVIVLVGLEVGLRLAGFSYYWAFSRVPDPYRGFAPLPGAKARQSQEGEAVVRINRHGFRDREWGQAAGGAHRIAVLGDSMTEAVQVPVEETWWRRLEGRLNACGYRETPVRLMSFAVSGYSPAQSLETLRHAAAVHGPAEVWLAFFPGNDVVESHPALAADPIRPYLRPAGDGWAMEYGFRDHPRYARKSSRWGRLYYDHLLGLRVVQAGVMVRHLLGVRAMADGAGRRWQAEPGVDVRVYAPPRDARWAEAWDAVRAVLARLRDEAEALGARFRVIGLTTGAQVAPEAGPADALAGALEVPDLFYPNWQVGRFAAADGYEFLDLAPVMASRAAEAGTYFHGFGAQPGTGHWNDEGHRAAAEILAARLCPAAVSATPGG